MRVYGWITMGAALLAMCGCSKEQSTPEADRALTFTAKVVWPDESSPSQAGQFSAVPSAHSKSGTYVEQKNTFIQGDMVGILAFNTPKSWADNKSSAKPYYAYNNKLTYLTRTFRNEVPIYYPSDGSKLTILAYHPYTATPNDANGIAHLGGRDWVGPHPIYYRTDPDPAKHVDLMVAAARDLTLPAPGSPAQAISLRFEHALCNVRFAAKMINQTAVNMGYSAQITEVRFTANLYSPIVSGYFLYDPDNTIFWWNIPPTADAILVSQPVNVTSATMSIISSTMQIPQTCGAAMVVKYRILRNGVDAGGGEFAPSIWRNDAWVRNQVFTYELSLNPKDNTVTLTSSIEAWKSGNEIGGVI